MDDFSRENLGIASLAPAIASGELIDNTLYVVSRGYTPARLGVFDLETREVTADYEIPSGSGAWGSTSINGGDDLFFGMYPDGEVYHFDTVDKELSQVATFDYLYGLDAAEGETQVYGGGYPETMIHEYDHKTGEQRELGPAVPSESYARSFKVTSDTVYVGVGSNAHLIAFDRDTETKENILPPELTDDTVVYDIAVSNGYVVIGTEFVGEGSASLAVINEEDSNDYSIIPVEGQRTIDSIVMDGEVAYFTTRFSGSLYRYDISTEELTELATPAPHEETRDLFLKENTMIGAFGSGAVWTHGLNTEQTELTDLGAAGLTEGTYPVQSLEILNGKPFVGGHWTTTIHDPETDDRQSYRTLGEPKTMVATNGKLYEGIYPGAIITEYNPNDGKLRDVAQVGEEQNRPRDLHYDEHSDLILLGTRPQYGAHGGALSAYNPTAHEIETVERNIIQDQSVTAITSLQGTVFAGGSIQGGNGTDPIADEARLAAWDPATHDKLWEDTPISDAIMISSIVSTEGFSTANGPPRIYGTTANGMFFIFNPETRSVTKQTDLGSAATLTTMNGGIYGNTGQTIFHVHPASGKISVLLDDLNTSSHLVADESSNLYYVSEDDLWKANVAAESRRKDAQNQCGQ